MTHCKILPFPSVVFTIYLADCSVCLSIDLCLFAHIWIVNKQCMLPSICHHSQQMANPAICEHAFSVVNASAILFFPPKGTSVWSNREIDVQCISSGLVWNTFAEKKLMGFTDPITQNLMTGKETFFRGQRSGDGKLNLSLPLCKKV